MMDAECDWCEMGVGARGDEEDEFSAGSKGNVGHGPSMRCSGESTQRIRDLEL